MNGLRSFILLRFVDSSGTECIIASIDDIYDIPFLISIWYCWTSGTEVYGLSSMLIKMILLGATIHFSLEYSFVLADIWWKTDFCGNCKIQIKGGYAIGYIIFEFHTTCSAAHFMKIRYMDIQAHERASISLCQDLPFIKHLRNVGIGINVVYVMMYFHVDCKLVICWKLSRWNKYLKLKLCARIFWARNIYNVFKKYFSKKMYFYKNERLW